MADSKVTTLGAGGGLLAAVLGFFAHVGDDCVRVGARAGSLADDIGRPVSRVAPAVAAGEEVTFGSRIGGLSDDLARPGAYGPAIGASDDAVHAPAIPLGRGRQPTVHARPSLEPTPENAPWADDVVPEAVDRASTIADWSVQENSDESDDD